MLDFLPVAAAYLRLDREKRQAQPVRIPEFRGAALEIQSATDMELVISGPSETGKTFSALCKLDSLLRAHPRSRAGIIRKVRATMTGSVLQTWERDVLPIRGGVAKFGGERPEFYEYPNGARAYVGGMDDPGKVLSSDRDWIYVNQAEEFALADWEHCSTRTTGRGAVTQFPQLFGDCNPGARTHWLSPDNSNRRASVRLLESRHVDNPTLYTSVGSLTAQGIRSLGVLHKLTGLLRSRLLDGQWVSVEGAVYEFDRAVHVIKRLQLPWIRRWVCGVDFGYQNPFVWQRWGVDDDDNMYLEREIYLTERTVKVHSGDIKKLNVGYVIDRTVADHDSEGRATLEENDISTVPAYKAIQRGIENLKERLKLIAQPPLPNTPFIGAKPDLVMRPRLYILEDACQHDRDDKLVKRHRPVCTLDEWSGYRYPMGVDGKPSLKEDPIKEDDHGMDTARYVAAEIDHLNIEGGGQFKGEAGDVATYALELEENERGPGDLEEEDHDELEREIA